MAVELSNRVVRVNSDYYLRLVPSSGLFLHNESQYWGAILTHHYWKWLYDHLLLSSAFILYNESFLKENIHGFLV